MYDNLYFIAIGCLIILSVLFSYIIHLKYFFVEIVVMLKVFLSK